MSTTPRTDHERVPSTGSGSGWSLESGSRQHDFLSGSERQRLLRSRNDRVITGLCGGIAEFTGARPGIVRLLFVLTALLSFGVVAAGYFLLSLLIPASPRD